VDRRFQLTYSHVPKFDIPMTSSKKGKKETATPSITDKFSRIPLKKEEIE
jgi:hypothetical protein